MGDGDGNGIVALDDNGEAGAEAIASADSYMFRSDAFNEGADEGDSGDGAEE